MKYIKYTLTLLVSLLLIGNSYAQELTEKERKKAAKQAKKNKPPEKGDIYFSPVPVIGSNPAFGFLYGAGAATSAWVGEPENTSLSSALVGFTFTTKNQFIFTAKSTVYLSKNKWILNGDWRYLNSSQPTFGLGTGPTSSKLSGTGFEYDEGLFSEPIDRAQQMGFKFIRLYETATKRVGKNLYAGIGLHYDRFFDINDQLLDLDASTPVITSYHAYNIANGFSQDASTTFGFSLNGIFDSRDNQNSPYKGQYANVSFRINPEFIGSDKNSTQLWIEYRNYFDLTGNTNNILAIWGIGNFTTSGTLPYMNLPASSWDQYGKTGRGFTQGRFRGENLMYAEVEYRKHLWASKKNPKFLGAVLYANVTTTDNKAADIKLFDYLAPAIGTGLRININQKARTNLTLDYAIGSYGSSGFYLRLNETF